MQKPDFKFIVSGLLILPLIILTVYTFSSGRPAKKNSKINIAKMKLSSPQDLPNEIASYLEENDFETALIRIEEEMRDPDVKTSKGMPLIVLSAEKNNYDIAALLASMGADVNLRDERTNETAIIKAARNNNQDMIRLLLASGGDINAQNRRGLSALKESIDKKNKPLMEFLTANGARSGASFENLMLYASQKNNVGVAAMLRCGVNPREKDKNGNTPLIIASARGDLDSVTDLLAYEADPNAQNNQGMTALIFAIRSGNRKIVERLLSIDETNINLANKEGQTPLFWAAYIGDPVIVNALLTLGADYTKKTRDNQTALSIAKSNNKTAAAKEIENFIRYTNLPKDKDGKVIVDKKAILQNNKQNTNVPNTDVVSSLENKLKKSSSSDKNNSAAGQQSPANTQAVNPQNMIPGFDMNSITKMMQQQGASQQDIEAVQQAQSQQQNQNTQANKEDQSVRSKFTPKNVSSKKGKTQINSLQTHSF